VAFGHPGSVPGVGFVHRDRSLVLPFGTTVSARVAISCAQSLRAVSLVSFDLAPSAAAMRRGRSLLVSNTGWEMVTTLSTAIS
jgi:hypothetical protein